MHRQGAVLQICGAPVATVCSIVLLPTRTNAAHLGVLVQSSVIAGFFSVLGPLTTTHQGRGHRRLKTERVSRWGKAPALRSLALVLSA